MSRFLLPFLALCLLATPLALAHGDHESDKPAAPGGLKLETLLESVLAGEGREVIVSRVSMPPHTSLPRHWHPGEEFAYIVEGTVTLWQKGKDDVGFHAGDVAMIPLEQVHTAITGDDPAVILVFRVHEEGKPERVLVEDE